MNKTVTHADIDKLIREAQVTVKNAFGRCVIVAVELKNGFVLVESHTFEDPMHYNEAMGMAMCIERIKNKLFELENYRLQN